MNPEPQIPVPETQPALELPEFRLASIENRKSKIENSRKPTGKIAKLPKAQRDIINQMLDDGATYKSIEIEMAKHGISLNGENISNWFDSGFQLYLQHQDRIAETRLLRENASDLVQDYNVIQFHQAANQLAVGQIFKSLTQQQLTDDPINFVRTLNALARLSRAALVLKQCEDESKALAETKKPETQADLDTQRKLVLSIMERGFGCKAAPGPIGYPASPAAPELPSEGGSSTSAPILVNESAPSAPSTCPSSPTSSYSPDGLSSPIENRYGKTSLVSKIENPCSPSSPPPSRPCRSETPESGRLAHPSTDVPLATGDHESLSHISHASHSSHPSTPDRPESTSDQSSPPIENRNSKIENCLDCRAPLPPLTPEGKRPFERCENCGVILPAPGLCVRPPNDYCHFCGAALPRRLPNGRRPRPTCHNCGTGLGRELFDDPNPTS